MAVQVVLIALGVFLGLAGEEWRQDSENRRQATETLRRFRTEIVTNRDTILGVKDYHAERLAEMEAYLNATEDEKANLSVRIRWHPSTAFRVDRLGPRRQRPGRWAGPRRRARIRPVARAPGLQGAHDASSGAA